jgi:hypothetical protein
MHVAVRHEFVHEPSERVAGSEFGLPELLPRWQPAKSGYAATKLTRTIDHDAQPMT